MRRDVWKRVQRGLEQYARTNGVIPQQVNATMRVLRRIVSMCGSMVIGRRFLYRLGCALFERTPYVFVPVCPDYSYEDGKYTYKDLRNGLPLLYLKHKPFLLELEQFLPNVKIIILLADHEGDLPELRAALNVSLETFRTNVEGSKDAIVDDCPAHWRVTTFSEQFPGFSQHAFERANEIFREKKYQRRLAQDTSVRRELYEKIGYHHSIQCERTAHVAAQYLCLGEQVVNVHGIICNHMTTSLSWYMDAGVAFVQNPVKIY